MRTMALLLITIIIIIPVQLWRAYVLCKIWSWFIIQIGMPTLTTMPAIGILLIFSFLKNDSHDGDKADAKNLLKEIIQAIINPAITLGVGALLHWWLA